MKRRAPACGMSSADQPPAEPCWTEDADVARPQIYLSSLGMDVYLPTWQSGVLKPSTGSPLVLCWNSHESAWKMGLRGSCFARWVGLLLGLSSFGTANMKGALSRKIDRLNKQARRHLVWNKDRSGQLALLETSFACPGQNQRDNEKGCAKSSTESDEVRMDKLACMRAAQLFCQLRSDVERLQMQLETERQRFNRLHRSQCVFRNLGYCCICVPRRHRHLIRLPLTYCERVWRWHRSLTRTWKEGNFISRL